MSRFCPDNSKDVATLPLLMHWLYVLQEPIQNIGGDTNLRYSCHDCTGLPLWQGAWW